ncbi:MAG: T9SS type A sorting domain-containing protein [Flavobacteriales bacterium]|nr:T9SS type A sorting domain-containing protein [Flavobacteriales bacterium]
MKPYLFAQDNPNNNPYNMRRFYYQDGDTTNTTEGPFYFWKRRYKYILSRWGYAPHLAIIEPFQETMQQLSMNNQVLCTNDTLTCPQANDDEYCRDLCRESRGTWVADQDLPDVLAHWTKDMIRHVRGSVDPLDPADSPLGEDKKLFLLSHGGGPWLEDPNVDQAEIDRYNRPYTIPELDLIDEHRYYFPGNSTDTITGRPSDENTPDWRMSSSFDDVQSYHGRFPSATAPDSLRKPINLGETTFFTGHAWTNYRDIEYIFHNYDVSFHNELWSGAFSGRFGVGTTWHWHRVFWWPRSFDPPPSDFYNEIFSPNGNEAQQPYGPFSHALGDTVRLAVPGHPAVKWTNRRLHHHFQPLTDLLNHPNWLDYGFFNQLFTPHKVYDPSDQSALECYYLKNEENNTAIGWVHNRNAWVMNSFYFKKVMQNMLGCTAPDPEYSSITLLGFDPALEYYVTWFPTRPNSTELPPDSEDPIADADNDPSTITLNLTGEFGSAIDNYLDTLRSDFAFIITPEPFVKSLRRPIEHEEAPMVDEWDFSLFPNPTRSVLFLRLPAGTTKEITLHDVAGKVVMRQTNVGSSFHQLAIGQLAMGAYWVRVNDGTNSKIKKLIIY